MPKGYFGIWIFLIGIYRQVMSYIDFGLIQKTFTGTFVPKANALAKKLPNIKAYIFDWDGVFNNGSKGADGSSPFNEVDSMGINMLRFNHYIRHGSNPIAGIITGEKNPVAVAFAKREHFHAVYYGIKTKKDALLHLCAAHDILPNEIAYFFDDITDLQIASMCGLRIMMGRKSNPMLTNLAIERHFADYITANDGGNNGIREAVELLKAISGSYEETIMQRAESSDQYRDYLNSRNIPEPAFYTFSDSKITEQTPK
jgi:3-deoxy-D-manno-octulosonate 8-phosphate phosphatase (KDO 8-P phosphatase)